MCGHKKEWRFSIPKWYLPFYTSDLMVVYNTTYKLFEVFCIHICRFYTPSACISELFRWHTFGDLWPFFLGSTMTPTSTQMLPFERPYQLSYLTSIDTIGLSRSVSELFRWPTFGDLWPFVSGSTVTPGSKPMVPFERPYSSSYLPPIDIFGLSRSISELFRWHTFGDLWPFIWGQPRPRGQPKWYHSKGHTHFPIWLPLTLFAYLVPFLR